MQINLSMCNHGDLEGVGFMSADHFLVCVQLAYARLLNTDFVVLMHILYLSRMIEFRMLLCTVVKLGPWCVWFGWEGHAVVFVHLQYSLWILDKNQ